MKGFNTYNIMTSSIAVLLLLQLSFSLTDAFAPTIATKATTTTTFTQSLQQQQKLNSKLIMMSKPDGMTDEEYEIAMEKATKAMTAFTNKYLQNTCTTLCTDKSVPAVVITGLAEHKVKLGTPLCPCRFYEDKEAEAKDGFWNCPCVPMRERHECHCMLFLTEDNPFAGTEQQITIDEVIDLSSGLKN